MTGGFDHHVHLLFERAAAVPEPQRAAFLDQACRGDDSLRARVEQLLQWDAEAGDFLEKTPVRIGMAIERPGDVIGRYTLVRELGEGGMSVVWLASQSEPISRQVAVKILKPGMDTRSILARFEQERQVLAHLDHPLVAGILDAGMSDRGRPYFVMEYVEGTILTTFCNERGLDVNQRLRLFMQVCDVVHHAHQRGIIHRDLKPTNILVTTRDGSYAPVVIDFGIAKAVGGVPHVGTIFTEHGQIIGTPEYMSPEQCSEAAGAMDVRTDIYSLGVVLYEMLCDRLPYDMQGRQVLDILRIIRDHPVKRPSTIDRRLAGDVETILLRAMEKRPEDRYQSALDVRRDIERYLDFRPIEARPRSMIYHVRMFSRRHRPLVAAGAVALASLLVGTVVTWRSAFVARAALRESERREQDLEVVTTFQESQLSDIDVEDMGENLRLALQEGIAESLDASVDVDTILQDVNFTSVALQMLDESVLQRSHESINTQFAGRPELRARLLHRLAGTMYQLGLHDGALPILIEALEIRREALGADHEDALQSMHAVGSVLSILGRYDESHRYLAEAHDRSTRAFGAEDRTTLRVGTTYGGVLRRMGNLADAERVWAATLDAQRRLLGPDDVDTMRTMNNIAIVMAVQGRLSDAEETWRELLERRRRVLGPEDPDTLGVLSNLGLILSQQGRYDDALPLIRESLDAERRRFGDDHTRTMDSMAALATLLEDTEDYVAAEQLQRECAEGRLGALGLGHPDTLRAQSSLAFLQHRLGRSAEAETEIRRVLEIQQRVLGELSVDALASMDDLAEIMHDLGRHDEAVDLSADVLERSHRALDADHWQTGMRLSRHGAYLGARTRDDEIGRLMHDGYDMVVNVLGPAHPEAREAASRLAEFYAARHADEPDAGFAEDAARWRRAVEGDV